jgi:imidazolonepropionase-like amidohydrolase
LSKQKNNEVIMIRKFLQFTMLFSCAFSSTITHAETVLIHAGSLLAVAGEKPLSRQTIVIKGQRITGVLDGFKAASEVGGEARVIDLSDAFVLPGLMDMHVHLQSELGPHRTRDSVKMSSQLMEIRSAWYAMNTMKAGFTTVRDCGSSGQEMYALRDGINKGWIDGPRIVAAGGVGITGGHADISGFKPELMRLWTDESICDGPYDCRRAARDVIKFGADLVKITSTGGVMTDRKTGTGQQMEMDELKEVVRAAARMGRKVASHAHEEDGIIAALEAGVASIEHGTYTGPRAIKLFKKTGAYLVPTLLAGDTVKRMAQEGGVLTDTQAEKAIRVGEAMMGNFEKAHKAGVKVAYGTDSGISIHGTNAQEAVLMVAAGMSPMNVIKTATINSADLIDMSNDIGTIEVGKYADIIAVSGSPLENIKELLDVDFVMKGGKVYKNE